MAKEKENKPRRRNAALSAALGRLQTMQGLAAAVALGGGVVLLAKMPHAYETLKEGQGKKPLTNKRVQILLILLLVLITRPSLKWRLWSIPVMALLTVAVQQHRVTYQEENPLTTELTENY